MKHDINHTTRVIIDNFDKIADVLGVQYEHYGNTIKMACPVHGGDNPSACVIFTSGYKSVGNWCCFTHGCEKQYGLGIVGFLGGVLENRYDKEFGFGDVIRFVEDAINNKVEHIRAETVRQPQREYKEANIHVDSIRSSLGIPSMYYIKRGYSRDVLRKYNVGFCNTRGKPFYLRTVVPIFDKSETHAVGFLGRTINDKCDKCGFFHYNKHKCPETTLEKYYSSKWINSKGFRKSAYLYNSLYSRPFIESSKTAIVVEGVGDCWRLEECGIRNGVGIFGCSLSIEQARNLWRIGARKLIVALDNDEAGNAGKEKISSLYGDHFKLRFVTPESDIGDTPLSEVKRLFI